MEAGKLAKVLCFAGILTLIVGLTALIVVLAVYLKPKSDSSIEDEAIEYKVHSML